MGIAVWGVTIKPKNELTLGGMLVFAQNKNVRLPTQLGACSRPPGLDGSLDCPVLVHKNKIDVRTHVAPYGVPMGLRGPRRDTTDPQRTAGGTVGPRFIGASPVWAARSSYWRSQCYWQH